MLQQTVLTFVYDDTKEYHIHKLLWQHFGYLRLLVADDAPSHITIDPTGQFRELIEFLTDFSVKTHLHNAICLKEQCQMLSLDPESHVAGRVESYIAKSCIEHATCKESILMHRIASGKCYQQHADFLQQATVSRCLQTFHARCLLPIYDEMVDPRCLTTLTRLYGAECPSEKQRVLWQCLQQVLDAYSSNGSRLLVLAAPS